jgi:hypothetical protein
MRNLSFAVKVFLRGDAVGRYFAFNKRHSVLNRLGYRAANFVFCELFRFHSLPSVLVFAGISADMTIMDISTVVAGVLVANFLTLGIIFNIRALDVPNPPLKNIIFALILMGAALVVALASAQSLSAIP